MKILLINSDIAKNRGDRAIAEGLIKLIRLKHPNAQITGISEIPERDARWYSIDFINSDVYTLNPLKWLKLMVVAYRSDVIYWGGGEHLKDYTNKASLWYWTLKTLMLKVLNKNIYGTFQGIGPTQDKLSKWLIIRIVNMTKTFIVRDEESYEKLKNWGAREDKLVCSSDPAVYPELEITDSGSQIIFPKLGISEAELSDFIAIAPRNWFHYKIGDILPYRYVSLFKGRKIQTRKNKKYVQSLVNLIDYSSKKAKIVILVPMHISEDVEFCKMLKKKCQATNIRILELDILNPQLIRFLFGKAKLMIGFRLHANIIATANYTPSINYYYVDKGRAYFKQLGLEKYAFPIEELLNPDFITSFSKTFGELTSLLDENSAQLKTRINVIRTNIRKTFENL